MLQGKLSIPTLPPYLPRTLEYHPPQTSKIKPCKSFDCPVYHPACPNHHGTQWLHLCLILTLQFRPLVSPFQSHKVVSCLPLISFNISRLFCLHPSVFHQSCDVPLPFPCIFVITVAAIVQSLVYIYQLSPVQLSVALPFTAHVVLNKM